MIDVSRVVNSISNRFLSLLSPSSSNNYNTIIIFIELLVSQLSMCTRALGCLLFVTPALALVKHWPLRPHTRRVSSGAYRASTQCQPEFSSAYTRRQNFVFARHSKWNIRLCTRAPSRVHTCVYLLPFSPSETFPLTVAQRLAHASDVSRSVYAEILLPPSRETREALACVRILRCYLVIFLFSAAFERRPGTS